MGALQKLTPEQREQIWRAVLAVLNLPEEKRLDLIGKEEERRKKIREQIDQAIKDIGVPIRDDQRRAFFRKFFEGRRAIEEQLRKENDERRKVLLAELYDRLQKEFNTAQETKGPSVEEKK
jgi:Spy/CpxP family protein refolding chaperone